MTHPFWPLLLITTASAWGDCRSPGASPSMIASAEATACRTLISADISSAIAKALTNVVSDPSPEGLRIEVLDYPRYPLPAGDLRFTIRSAVPAAPDGTTVIHGNIDEGPLLIWAKVRISTRRNAVVAKEDLPPGTLLRDGQLEKRELWIPFPEPPGRIETEPRAMVGAQLKRAAKAGQVIQPGMIELPLDIRRGQVVDLHIRSGGAHLRLQAVASQNAHRGESVSVRVGDKGPTLFATASGPGQVALENGQPEESAKR